eukprot:scaffold247155_cov36-Tisochrysis_lutea.AAC.1
MAARCQRASYPCNCPDQLRPRARPVLASCLREQSRPLAGERLTPHAASPHAHARLRCDSQAVTSAGSGSQAALDAERWISENAIGGLEDNEGDGQTEECHPEDYDGWTMKQVR